MLVNKIISLVQPHYVATLKLDYQKNEITLDILPLEIQYK